MNDALRQRRDRLAEIRKTYRTDPELALHLMDNLAPMPEDRPGDARGFIGPLKPPSQDWTKRDADWERRSLMATSYMWGRMDAGESRNVNANFAFTEAYADAYWAFDRQYRVFMPCMSSALEAFESGEFI